MGRALYRKYRSKSLDEVIGQDHITKTLKNALETGRISHAYLFTGPRGVGKTSVARILAHEVNSLAYDDTAHVDIIEIDAASNRRIDEIRELREKVRVAPVAAKYKVYIIDEVHMLTKEAFNALLKTLEEPPAHVIFILATTDAHKVPETITSRTQRFAFKPIALDDLSKQLAKIAQAEDIKADLNALQLLSEHGQGSFRDSISLLDQLSGHGKLTAADVESFIGLAPGVAVDQLVQSVTDGLPGEVSSKLTSLFDQGVAPSVLAKQISQKLKASLLQEENILDPNDNLALLRRLAEINSSTDPETFLEISLLEQAVSGQKSANMIQPKPKSKTERPVAEVAEIQGSPNTPKNDSELWAAILTEIKKRHNTLYGIIRMAEPSFEDQRLTLTFSFPFHKKRCDEAENRKALLDIVEQISGKKLDVVAVVGAESKNDSLKQPDPSDETLTTISNIFGGAELLES